MTRNGTHTGADMPDYSKADEMDAFDSLPAEFRDVLRDAPFSVSAADIRANQAVMDALKSRGDAASEWLSAQLLTTYRTKILASS